MKIWAWPSTPIWTKSDQIWTKIGPNLVPGKMSQSQRRRVSSFWYFFNQALTKHNEHLQTVSAGSVQVLFQDARFEYSSSNPSSFSLSSCDVTPHPHPTHSAFSISKIIIQWWNPKSENCWRSRYHPPWRKYFCHLASEEMFSHRHGNLNLTILTPIPSDFLTFLDFHHVIILHTSFNIHRIQDTQRTHRPVH